MTKADIVSEISKTTGIDKACVLETVEKFMEVVKGEPRSWRKRISSWLRQLHREDPLGEDRPQHLKEHHNNHPRAQDPGIQARQGVHGRCQER